MELCTKATLERKEDGTIEVHSVLPKQSEDGYETIEVEKLLNYVQEKTDGNDIDLTKITVLELSKCNLTEIPSACKDLNLKHLGLSCNSLEQVPSCLYNGLKTLESLDLSYNKISNFEIEPDCLPNIRKINLRKNNLSNIPKWFLTFRCTNLEEFDFSENRAQHYDYLKHSCNLGILKLKKLSLVSSCLLDKDYDFLKSFKKLEYLDISNSDSPHINKFYDIDELFVKTGWEGLQTLKINNLSLSLFPSGINWMYSLQELHATHDLLTWIPEEIEYLVNLEVLVVSNNTLVSLPRNLATLQKLRVIQASNNGIEYVPDFSEMPNLKTLDLYENKLDEVKYNVDTIEFVDLEFNYMNTNNLKNYEKMKEGLRELFHIDDRWDGVKAKVEEVYESDSSSDGSSCDYEEFYINHAVSAPINIDDDESWDSPPVVHPTHPDIDSIDEDWDAQVPTRAPAPCTEKVYVSDDDLLFEDLAIE